jgi:type II secretory ATPase GspE/PulE/Tfp pilus assembly ATPase PilB-like protein
MSTSHTPRQGEAASNDTQLIQGALFSAKDLAFCSTSEARSLVSFDQAVRLRILPVAVVRSSSSPARVVKLHCAAADVSPETYKGVRFALGLEVSLEQVPGTLLEEATIRAYLGSESRLTDRLRKLLSAATRTSPAQASSSIPTPVGDAAQFVAELVEFGFARGASDLHLSPSPLGGLVKMRIDGHLLSHTDTPYPLNVHEAMMTRIKVLAGLDISCKKLPQDGAFAFKIGDTERSVRVSTLPTLHGESAVLRFMYSRAIPSINALGLEPTLAGILQETISRTNGIIVLTGPTGSGKSTTMYSIVSELLNKVKNIVTIEDPVEIPIPEVVQVQINEPQGLDYPRAIRSVLRHDPDVILIGEMRDPLSAAIAIECGTTGHLTLSSLHMSSALNVVERFNTLGISSIHCVGAVSLVVNQRLLGKLCENCKVVDRENSLRFGETIHAPTGCPRCNGLGFTGRILVTEALDLRSAKAKEVCANARSLRQLLEDLPSHAYLSWPLSLQFQLLKGTISAKQFQTFIDQEMMAI